MEKFLIKKTRILECLLKELTCFLKYLTAILHGDLTTSRSPMGGEFDFSKAKSPPFPPLRPGGGRGGGGGGGGGG